MATSDQLVAVVSLQLALSFKNASHNKTKQGITLQVATSYQHLYEISVRQVYCDEYDTMIGILV